MHRRAGGSGRQVAAHPGFRLASPAARAAPARQPCSASIASGVRSSPLGSISSWPSASAHFLAAALTNGRPANTRSRSSWSDISETHHESSSLGSGSTATVALPSASARSAWSGGRRDHGGRRAEVVAREIPDLQARSLGANTATDKRRLQAGQRRDQLAPHAHQHRRRKAAAGALGQAPQDLRLTRRAQRRRPSGPSPLTSPMRRTTPTARSADRAPPGRCGRFRREDVRGCAVVSIDGLKLARNGGAE